MIKKITGVVIKVTDFSDSSKIINVLTEDNNVIGIIAKGARRLKSKLRTGTVLFTYGDFNVYYKESGLSSLISIDIKESFINFNLDIEAYSYACLLTDIVNQTAKEDGSMIFDLYKNSLIKLNQGFDPLVITNIFEVQLFNFLGITPSYNTCVQCGNPNVDSFSVDLGGAICVNCHTQDAISYKAYKLLKLYELIDISKITKLNLEKPLIKEVNQAIDRYFERYSGLYLKSKKTIIELTK